MTVVKVVNLNVNQSILLFVLNAAPLHPYVTCLGGLDLCVVCEDGHGFRLSLPPPSRFGVSVLFSIEEAGAMNIIDFSTLPGSIYFQTRAGPSTVSGSQGIISAPVLSSSWASRWDTYTLYCSLCVRMLDGWNTLQLHLENNAISRMVVEEK